MGTVYRAADLHAGGTVALKVLRDVTDDNIKRFGTEAEVLHRLRHPRIVRYVAHGQMTDGKLYIAMEWLSGQTLSRRMKATSLTLSEAYEVALALSEAVAVAHHAGVLHRDIKPGNIWLVDGEPSRIKLLDFGLARGGVGREALTHTGELLGTPGYIAPEQARGSRDIDPRADVFSLGAVFYLCFTGRRAFTGDDALAVLAKLVLESPARIGEVRPGLPPALESLVARMLAKVRDDRPRDGAAVLQELEPMRDAVVGAKVDPSSRSGSSLEPLPSITVKEQRIMSLVLARLDVPDEQAAERMRALQTAVEPYGGSLDRLIDGSLIVTVAVGRPAEQTARAGRCALALRTILGAAPIALAAGRGLKTQGGVLGEAIDRAADLLSLGHEDRVRIDEAAAALMRDRFDVGRDPHGYFLRGVQGEDDYTRKLLGRPTKLVGRNRELRNLEALFEECISEPVSRAVLVTAPAGVGKSRLRYEFLRRLTQQGVVIDEDGDERAFQVWMGRGDPMSAGAAFGMVAGALRRVIGVRLGEPFERRRRKLLARIRRTVPSGDAQRVAEFVGELIGTPFDDATSVQLRAARQDPVVMGDQMRRAFEDFLRAETAQRPVLIVLEDLHWGDRPSLSLLDAVLRNLQERPFMVLAFARPEIHQSFPGLWAERDLQEVRLARLTPKACATLVRQVLGEGASDELVERVVGRAEGNAFYLEELIRAAAEGRGDRLPESVLAMVQSRLDALHGQARRILRGASVFGQVFWRDAVAALVGREGCSDLDHWLSDLEDRELVTRRPDARFRGQTEYVFRHALLREAAYAALTENDRALGHRLAGGWLESVGDEEPVVLAEHFERGGDAAHATRWYMKAAEQALEGDDLDGAMARAERGVACGADGEALGELRLLQANAHRWRGEFAEMRARVEVAAENLDTGSARWCKAMGNLAVACRATADYDGLVSVAEELAALDPPPVYQPAHAEAAARTAQQLFIIGWARPADDLLRRVEPLTPVLENTHPAVVGWMENARAFGALYLGDAGTYLELSRRSARRFERAGDVRSEANARVHLGFAFLQVGAYPEAEVALREALVAARRLGLFNVVATAMNNLGLALAHTGRLEEATAVETEAIRLAASQEDRRLEGGSHHYLAIITAMRGDHAEASRIARHAASMLHVAPPLRAHALATRARCLLEQGLRDEALTVATEALEQLESLGGIEEGEAAVRLVYAEALEHAGKPDQARAHMAVALARLEQRAMRITDVTWRERFLNEVAENRRTVELARAWGTEAAAIEDVVGEDTYDDALPDSARATLVDLPHVGVTTSSTVPPKP